MVRIRTTAKNKCKNCWAWVEESEKCLFDECKED